MLMIFLPVLRRVISFIHTSTFNSHSRYFFWVFGTHLKFTTSAELSAAAAAAVFASTSAAAVAAVAW